MFAQVPSSFSRTCTINHIILIYTVYIVMYSLTKPQPSIKLHCHMVTPQVQALQVHSLSHHRCLLKTDLGIRPCTT